MGGGGGGGGIAIIAIRHRSAHISLHVGAMV